tara:strand:- start:37 stop:1002 length:966 start_codon:yes stop_codon:yes gene_type:complete
MLLTIVAIIIGFCLLIWGADRFIIGAAGLARNLGISPLVIGIIIVGFGTSAPEIIISIMAAIKGNPSIAIGNAIGSNITNIGLIVGSTALIMPLIIKNHMLRSEYLILIIVSIGIYLLLIDRQLSFIDGVILLVTLIMVLFFITKKGLKEPIQKEDLISKKEQSSLTMSSALIWFFIGLITLSTGSHILVWGAVEIATSLGVSELIIGLTIVAIGTSLPELAASVASALKNEPEIAIGNVIGSNIYNLLGVLCVPGLVSAPMISNDVIARDLPIMLLLTFFLYLFGKNFHRQGKITRLKGIVLLFAFFTYQGWLFIESTSW